MSTRDTILYYPNLLITEYIGKPKAYATTRTVAAPFLMPQTPTQDVTFSPAPSEGSFKLKYGISETVAINWDASASDVETALRGIEGLESVSVTGSIDSGALTVTFNGVPAPAEILAVVESSLDAETGVAETDLTIPLAVQDAFNITGSGSLAKGVQLDIIGKYVGVNRVSVGTDGVPVQLNDTDFLTLIHMGIIRNGRDSSLYGIVNSLYQFFGSGISVVDYASMFLLYDVSATLLRTDLFQAFISQGLLPRPMAVGMGLQEFVVPYFGVMELDGEAPDGMEGFSELLAATPLLLDTGEPLELSSGGDLLIFSPDAPGTETTGGGSFAELYEVA